MSTKLGGVVLTGTAKELCATVMEPTILPRIDEATAHAPRPTAPVIQPTNNVPTSGRSTCGG